MFVLQLHSAVLRGPSVMIWARQAECLILCLIWPLSSSLRILTGSLEGWGQTSCVISKFLNQKQRERAWMLEATQGLKSLSEVSSHPRLSALTVNITEISSSRKKKRQNPALNP